MAPKLSNNRLAAFLVIGGVVVILMCIGAVACNALRSPAQPAGVEVEDCDAEDYRNRESDCGFTDGDRRKTPAVRRPTPAKTKR